MWVVFSPIDIINFVVRLYKTKVCRNMIDSLQTNETMQNFIIGRFAKANNNSTLNTRLAMRNQLVFFGSLEYYSFVLCTPYILLLSKVRFPVSSNENSYPIVDTFFFTVSLYVSFLKEWNDRLREHHRIPRYMSSHLMTSHQMKKSFT